MREHSHGDSCYGQRGRDEETKKEMRRIRLLVGWETRTETKRGKKEEIVLWK